MKIRKFEETMKNNESPVKLFQAEEEKLIIQLHFCLILGIQGEKDDIRKPKQKGLTSFIEALLLCKH